MIAQINMDWHSEFTKEAWALLARDYPAPMPFLTCVYPVFFLIKEMYMTAQLNQINVRGRLTEKVMVNLSIYIT